MVRHTRESGAKSRSGQAEKPPAKPERIAKALARAGVASRREVERLVGLGKVAVNGRILESPAVLVLRTDVITVSGKVVNAPEPTRVWRYHKPVGLLTSHKDPEGRPTVFEHLPEGLPRVISVGRLDINSEGLLLLTNDGDLARALELPSNGWPRVYRARAHGHTTQAKLDTLKGGITVDGVNYGPIEAKLDKAQEAGSSTSSNLWITVTVSEGKNREVRRVLEALGMKVNRLIRLAYGPFQLGTLAHGAAEEIGPRVLREQLAGFIAPQNMPEGDRTTTPLTKPSRRLPTNALADPRRKPSKVRDLAAREEAMEKARAARPARIERPSPARPDRPYKARDERPQGDRPYKARSDRPAPSGERSYKPRGERPEGERPYKPRADRPASAAGGERTYKPRTERPDGDRPYKPRADRPASAGGGERTYKPRTERPDGDRPYKPRADRPASAGGGERTYKPRTERSEGDRPYKPRADRPISAGGGERTYKPRTERPDGDRPFKPRTERPAGDRKPAGGGYQGKPRGSGGEGFKPRPGGGKPGPKRTGRPEGFGPSRGPRKPRGE